MVDFVGLGLQCLENSIFTRKLIQCIIKMCRRRQLDTRSDTNLTADSFSLAGIIKGDELMVINGAIVSDLDMMYLESVLQEEQALCMMMR